MTSPLSGKTYTCPHLHSFSFTNSFNQTIRARHSNFVYQAIPPLLRLPTCSHISSTAISASFSIAILDLTLLRYNSLFTFSSFMKWLFPSLFGTFSPIVFFVFLSYLWKAMSLVLILWLFFLLSISLLSFLYTVFFNYSLFDSAVLLCTSPFSTLLNSMCFCF